MISSGEITLCLFNKDLIFKWDYLGKYMLIKSIGRAIWQRGGGGNMVTEGEFSSFYMIYQFLDD